MANQNPQRHSEIEPDIRPKFGVIQGGGESSAPTGDLRSVQNASDLNDKEKRPSVIPGGGESTDDRATLRSVSNEEKSPDQVPEIPFTGSGSSNEKMSIRGRFFGSLKKNSAVTAIVGLLLTGVFGLSLLSPSLLLMQFRETLLDKFNDQLAAMDLRQTVILKKKLSKTTVSGVCGSKVTLNCKYRTLGERHIKRLNAAGIEIKGGETFTGRVRPDVFVFEGREISPDQLLNEARNSAGLRSAMRHGYNPKFAAFSDAVAADVRSRLGIKKSRTITPSSDKEKMVEDLKKTASGDTGLVDGQKLTPVGDPENPTGYIDSNGTSYSLEEGKTINGLIDEVGERADIAKSVSKTAVSSGIKGALTSTALGAGAVDSACTVWTTIRVAGFAAKIYGQRQLIRYGNEYLKAPDATRANAVVPIEQQISPEEIELLGSILTTPNAEGKTATDSDGYHYAANGDVFNAGQFDTDTADKDATGNKNVIKNETAKYVNGQIIPDNAMASIVRTIGTIKGGGDSVSSVDSTCGFVKSWKGQTALVGLAVVGGVIGFFSGGTSIGAGAAAQLAVSAAASIAIAAITPKLMDMAKGELINGTENGNEAGNAIVSGVGGYNAQASQARGLAVLDKKDAVEYAQASESVIADYNEVDRYERSPFDPNSKNTFVGSIANSLLPYVSKVSRSGSTITSTTSLVASSFSSLFAPSTRAAETKINEFESCNDPEYAGLAADPFCNLRYGISKKDLSKDPEEVLQYMIRGEYVDADTEDGAPGGLNGDVYQQYIEQCMERQSSIGDKLSSGSEGDGENCIQGKGGENEERNRMFRLFYIDVSIQEGMDSDFSVEQESSEGTAGELRVATYNVLGYSHKQVNYQERMDKGIKALKDENIGVAGLQEFQSPQYDYFTKMADEYRIYPKDWTADGHASENSIIWKDDDYRLIDSGYIPDLKYFGGSKLNAPWVKLQNKSTFKEFYFLNTHDPASVNGDESKARLDNANQHRKFIESLGEVPAIITGDFNSGYCVGCSGGNGPYQDKAENLTYCVLTKDNLMRDAYDIGKNREAKCPNPPEDGDFGKLVFTGGVDHIFLSSDLDAGGYKIKPPGVAGSDHPFIAIGIPSLGSASESSSTPGSDIAGDDYAKECSQYRSQGVKCSRQCVDFVKFRLLKHKVSKFKGGSLGNGKDVVNTLGRLGYKVDTTPAVHAVFSTSRTSQPAYGHTGMVSAVNADGSITVEEYNIVAGSYGTRKFTAAQIKANGFTFAHTEVDYK